MKSSTYCQLLLPGVVRELAESMHRAPALQTLLKFARRQAAFAGDDLAWRCAYFGVSQQQDLPVAPFAALGDGLPPGSGYWLRADPVHLHLQRDSLVIHGVAHEHDQQQANAMVHALNAHFSGEGMMFFAPHPSRWYLRLASEPQLMTTPLPEVAGRNVDHVLPRGADALLWHRYLNEIQMLLHGHAANVGLEQQGRLPVNSVWIWGGGVMPDPLPRHPARLWARDALTCGLARAHGNEALALPDSAAAWLAADKVSTSHLLVLDQLQAAGMGQGLPVLGEVLEQLDREWIAPLLDAVRTGVIGRLDLHLAGRNRVQAYRLTRPDLWKFWRRIHPWEADLG